MVSNEQYGLFSEPYISLDPSDIYSTRARQNSAMSKGVERLAYRIFGSDKIGSFALALDPFSQFAVDPRLRSDKRRKRILSHVDLDRSRKYNYTSKTMNKYRSRGTFKFFENTYTSGSLLSYTAASLLPDFCIDTTDRTRNLWETGGPLELFKNRYVYDPFRVTLVRNGYNTVDTVGGLAWTKTRKSKSYVTTGPFARLTNTSMTTLLNYERSNADVRLNEYAPKMLNRSLPTIPRFDLFRSIAELKDLPSLRSLVDIPLRLRNRVFQLSDIGDAILAKEFGIDPLISDIRTMLDLPQTVAKRVNFLIAQNGKETTYRNRIVFDDPLTSFPSFSVGDMKEPLSAVVSNDTLHRREVEIRSAVKAVVEFPNIELPEFKEQLFDDLLGTRPTFRALYELTPWSWLIDWFSGLDDYIGLIESINKDESLINEGWLTYKSNCTLSNIYTQEHTTTSTTRHNNGTQTVQTQKPVTVQQTDYRYTYTKRISYSDIGVSTVAGFQNLSDFQSLILSALVLQRV